MHTPESPGRDGKRGGGAEKLDAVEPHGGDAVFLRCGSGGGELEDDAGPGGRAARRVGVVRGGRWEADGVGEVVAECEDRAFWFLAAECRRECRVETLEGNVRRRD